MFSKLLEILFCLGEQVTGVSNGQNDEAMDTLFRVIKSGNGKFPKKGRIFKGEIIYKCWIFYWHVWSLDGILFHRFLDGTNFDPY